MHQAAALCKCCSRRCPHPTGLLQRGWAACTYGAPSPHASRACRRVQNHALRWCQQSSQARRAGQAWPEQRPLAPVRSLYAALPGLGVEPLSSMPLQAHRTGEGRRSQQLCSACSRLSSRHRSAAQAAASSPAEAAGGGRQRLRPPPPHVCHPPTTLPRSSCDCRTPVSITHTLTWVDRQAGRVGGGWGMAWQGCC